MAAPSAISQQGYIRQQMAALTVGYPALVQFQTADGFEAFRDAPVDYGGALRHVAYFEIVAARLLRSAGLRYAGLAAAGAAVAAKATPYMSATPFTSGMTEVLTDAARAIAAEVAAARSGVSSPSNVQQVALSQAGAVAAYLMGQASPTAIQQSQGNDEGPIAQIRQLLATGMTILKVTAVVGVVGLGFAMAALVWWLRRRARGR